jgi:hypothetical protein
VTPNRLPTLSLRRLRDTILEGDPGCLCDPELFTGPADIEPEDEPAQDRAARIAVAREVCAACPVRLACLAYALRTRPAAGVWAGFTSEEIAETVTAANRPARPGPEHGAAPGRRRARADCRGGMMARRSAITPDPAAVLAALGAVWSPDFGAYASGQLDASAVRCVLCGKAPCDCPPFGAPGYLALVARLHGRARGGEA